MLDRRELILEGLAYTLMGMVVVFAILIIIMLVIKAMALFSNGKEENEKTQKASAPAPVVKKETAPTQKNEDDKVIIAVITVAIAAELLGSAQDGFRIRSYKKVSDGVWNKAGRREVLDNRI